MNAYPLFQAQLALDLANARAAELRAQAAEHRRARGVEHPGRLAAISARVGSLRTALSRTANEPAAPFPRLSDYPYRS